MRNLLFLILSISLANCALQVDELLVNQDINGDGKTWGNKQTKDERNFVFY